MVTMEADNPFDSEHGEGSFQKVQHAKHIGFAMLHCAANQEGQFPESFEEIIPYLHHELSEEARVSLIASAPRYEILFHGTRQAFNALPPTTITVREKESWIDQQGRRCRACCFADGSAAIWPEGD